MWRKFELVNSSLPFAILGLKRASFCTLLQQCYQGAGARVIQQHSAQLSKEKQLLSCTMHFAIKDWNSSHFCPFDVFSRFIINGEIIEQTSSQTKHSTLSIHITLPILCFFIWLTKLYIVHLNTTLFKPLKIWFTSLKTLFRMKNVGYSQQWIPRWINQLERY